MPVISKYPIPEILTGICDAKAYHKWLDCKADALQKRDKQLGRAVASTCSQAIYKEKIHAAVLASDGSDPYTGDALRWDLMGKWDENKKLPAIGLVRSAAAKTKKKSYGAMRKEFFLLPVVDHIDPESDVLEFEICSWIVNEGKSQQTPREYVALCEKVAEKRRGS
jgi:hypothetical protein